MKSLAIAICLAALAACAAWGGTAAPGEDLKMEKHQVPFGPALSPAAPTGEKDAQAGEDPKKDDDAEEADDEKPPAFCAPGALPQGDDLLRMAAWAAGKTEEAGPQMDPMKVLDQVVENMGRSEELLSQKHEAGQEAIQTETKVIEDLSALVEYSKQKQQKKQKQQQKKQEQSKKDSQKQSQGAPKPASGQGEPKTSKSPNAAKKEQATHGQVNENGEKGENPNTMAERWGLLPENAPQETKQAMQDMILPQYRELLDRYYYNLSQHRDEGK